MHLNELLHYACSLVNYPKVSNEHYFNWGNVKNNSKEATMVYDSEKYLTVYKTIERLLKCEWYLTITIIYS